MGTSAVQPIINWGQRVRNLPEEIAHPIDTIESWLSPPKAVRQPIGTGALPPQWEQANRMAAQQSMDASKPKLYSKNPPAKGQRHGHS